MNAFLKSCLLASLLCAHTLAAQESAPLRQSATGNYASDIGLVTQAQEQALAQAREMLEQTENPAIRRALAAAIKEMDRSKTALALARTSPEQLPAAVAAQQAAYQALLKTIPRENQVSRSRRGASSGGRAGQPGRQQLDQLEMTSEENRYETEREASAAPTEQQREKLQIADRLKQLAQRQQDLNDRLKELQTTLPEARTEKEREEAQRQLKRLGDEERQMLADVDELRQQMEQSPNASSLSKARQQLEQTRSDTQRATQELDHQSASQALAAGTRAQQGLQDLRQDLRSQTSSQFSGQMRQMRNQARELARQEDELGRGLEALINPEHKSLDDSAPRQQLTQQIARQQSALTNLLSGMQNLSEQAETTEPLLSQQLYDTLRRANQMHTENYLDAGAQLVSRGLLSQASGAERFARTNINELRQRVERAAESVLGSEADALRYAQKELDDLAGRLEREVSGPETDSNSAASSPRGSNSPQDLAQSAPLTTSAGNGANAAAGNAARKSDGREASGQNPQGRGQREAQPGGDSGGNRPNDTANNAPRESDGQASVQRPEAGGQQEAQADGAGGGLDRLRQVVRQIGASGGAGGLGYGPITGNDFVDWSSRMRDVEQVLDSPNLRNQLATARERVAELRAQFRQSGIKPKTELVRRQVLAPITEVRGELREDLARLSNASSLVPLDHDPVPEAYSELVHKYYEKLGDAP